jgi:hypothetical protein
VLPLRSKTDSFKTYNLFLPCRCHFGYPPGADRAGERQAGWPADRVFVLLLTSSLPLAAIAPRLEGRLTIRIGTPCEPPDNHLGDDLSGLYADGRSGLVPQPSVQDSMNMAGPAGTQVSDITITMRGDEERRMFPVCSRLSHFDNQHQRPAATRVSPGQQGSRVPGEHTRTH